MRTKDDLRQYQALPLDLKISLTQRRIRDWVNYWGTNGVYVSFSGGKDSTVLLHIVRQLYPDIEAVFVNTGLEYPEIQKFVKTFDNVTILRPKMRFDEVIKKYGYPIIGKKQANVIELARRNKADGKYSFRLRQLGMTAEEAKELGLELPDGEMLERYENSYNGSKFQMTKYRHMLNADFEVSAFCCDVMKKKPAFEYQKETGKKPIIATMADESMIREHAWLKKGCNAFDAIHPTSQPMSFWTQQDVLQYIKKYSISIAPVYGEVVEETQVKYDGVNTVLQAQLFETGAPLMTTGCDRTGCIFCAFGCHMEKEPSRFQQLKKTHPRQYEYCMGGGEYDENGVWKPNRQGLGMGHVFDELNKIYGDGFIKY